MIFTIPNLVSFVRILMIPVFLWLLFGRDDPAAAGWLLGAIGATDWVDGYLARRLDQVSEVGKVLDPVADRGAVAAAVIGGWVSGALPWPIALAIVIRETVVTTGALLLAARVHDTVEVRRLGKAATMALYIAIPGFLIYDGTGHAFFGWVAWVFVIPGLILYYVVAGQYAADVRRMLARGPAVSSADPTMGADG
jgi:cardiolipin synthase